MLERTWSAAAKTRALLLQKWFFSREETRDSEPLIVPPLVIIEEPAMLETGSSDWVVQKVKSFYHIVGLSCEGFEDELTALFTAIDPS